MLTNPRYEILELGLTELIGTDEEIAQNEYGGSVSATLGDGVRPVSGEILSFMLFSTEEGTGSIQTPAGSLILFDTSPAISAGDAAMVVAAHLAVIGRVDVAAADWHSDANGAIVCKVDCPIPFHNLHSIHAVWFHSDANSYNDLSGDDEQLRFNAWYRRDT